MKILISRTDSIGDVILTLPLCGWIKRNIPHSEVHFLCQKLTIDIVRRARYVDQVHIWNGVLPGVDVIIHVFPKKEIAIVAKKQKIDIRIGTSHRLFHWTTCNQLINFSRKKSDLHEAQLNFRLLRGLGIDHLPSLDELVTLVAWENGKVQANFLSRGKFNVVFHIKSRRSAKEWKATNYMELALKLPTGRFNIILTGTALEGKMIKREIPQIFELSNTQDSTGKLSLSALMDLIESADGLLACSTGPLHIASICGTHSLGLYPKKRPMHAGRWGPIGSNSDFIEESEELRGKYLEIAPNVVLDKITSWLD